MGTVSPGEHLTKLRLRLGISTRDVEKLSQQIAETEGNPEYQISNPWLTQLENSDSVPSIFKLYSLSAIYRIKLSDLLLLFGVDPQKSILHPIRRPSAEHAFNRVGRTGPGKNRFLSRAL